MFWLLMVVIFAALALAGCSQHAPGPAAANAGHSAPANPCDRQVITEADLAGILSAPIVARKPIPGDAQSCTFETTGFPSVTVSVRPGVGRATVDTWLAGKMPLNAIPITGVGDRAAWQADLHEIIAQRNDVLCDIQAAGATRDFNGEPADLPKRLGAVCDRIFTHFTDPSKG